MAAKRLPADSPDGKGQRGVVEAPGLWRLDGFRGRIAELSGEASAAALSLAFRLVLEAQERGEPAAWVTGSSRSFFPPDVAETGVDLDALVVVRLLCAKLAPRAADLLLRSGGFGLVVVDLGGEARMPLAVQSRLGGLARKHGAALLFITEKPSRAPSLGPLVSLRVETRRLEKDGDGYLCEARALKDKRLGIGWRHLEACHAPDGLR